MDTLVTNAKIVRPDAIVEGAIGIENGKISKIFKKGMPYPEEASTIDAGGNYVLPGLIEVHGHFREPGLTHKGTYETESRAALAGGVTTTMDQPNTNPPTTTRKQVENKRHEMNGRMYTDHVILIHGATDNLDELKALKDKEVIGVKVFMTGQGQAPTIVKDYDGALLEIARICADKDLPLLVHAEHDEVANANKQKAKKQSPNNMKTWGKALGPEVVEEAVKVLINVVRKSGVRLYNLHTSTPEEFMLIKKAQDDGLNIVGEVVGYHLFWSTQNIDGMPELGTKMKVSPAIRTQDRVDWLWDRLRAGMTGEDDIIFSICSEHTPHHPDEKPADDMWAAKPGSTGIQENLPMLITEAVKRFGIDKIEDILKYISRMTAANIANYYRLKTKGHIEPGYDADLVFLDTTDKWKIAEEDLLTLHPSLSAYIGKEVIGRPVLTMLRGEIVYKQGKIIDRHRPSGKLLRL